MIPNLKKHIVITSPLKILFALYTFCGYSLTVGGRIIRGVAILMPLISLGLFIANLIRGYPEYLDSKMYSFELAITFAEYMSYVIIITFTINITSRYILRLSHFNIPTRDTGKKVTFGLYFITAMIFIRVFMTINELDMNEWLSSFTIVIINFNVDIGKTSHALIVESLWHRIVSIRENLQDKLTSIQCPSIRAKTIKESVQLCKEICDIYKSVDIVIKCMTLTGLISAFLRILIRLTSLRNNMINTQGELAATVLMLLTAVIYPNISTFFVELVHSEYDKLKYITIVEFKNATDKNIRCILGDLLTVWDIRKFRLTMWRLFPIDISLPFNFIGLIVTYYIVIAQLRI